MVTSTYRAGSLQVGYISLRVYPHFVDKACSLVHYCYFIGAFFIIWYPLLGFYFDSAAVTQNSGTITNQRNCGTWSAHLRLGPGGTEALCPALIIRSRPSY